MKLHSRFTNTGFMLQPRCVWSSFFEKIFTYELHMQYAAAINACLLEGFGAQCVSGTPTSHVVSKYKYRMHTSSTITWAWRDAGWRLHRTTLWRQIAGKSANECPSTMCTYLMVVLVWRSSHIYVLAVWLTLNPMRWKYIVVEPRTRVILRCKPPAIIEGLAWHSIHTN